VPNWSGSRSATSASRPRASASGKSSPVKHAWRSR
jgi:hypothetical protein